VGARRIPSGRGGTVYILRQVFGLAGLPGLKARISNPRFPVFQTSAFEGSFLLTAAGQSRISTGFPFKGRDYNRLTRDLALYTLILNSYNTIYSKNIV